MPFFEIKRDIAVVMEVVLKGARPKRPYKGVIDDAVWMVLEACWSQHPARRPDAATLAQILDLIVELKNKGTDINISYIVFLLKPPSSPTITADPRRTFAFGTKFPATDEGRIDHGNMKYRP